MASLEISVFLQRFLPHLCLKAVVATVCKAGRFARMAAFSGKNLYLSVIHSLLSYMIN